VLSEKETWRESDVLGLWNLAENEFERLTLEKAGAWKEGDYPKVNGQYS
jgi:hypothetical protein